tara:strand:+ start:646 stop:1215 length:570 start_codon:yes stop_codon:yes gene_type:complete
MLDEWARENIKVSKSKGCFFHRHVENHKEMFEECEAFQGWIRCEQEDVEGLNNRIEYHVSKLEILNVIRDNSPKSPWNRFFALPTKEDFPTIYKFLEENKHIYKEPMLCKFGPGCKLNLHIHGCKAPAYQYNMSINFPEGCKFTVLPDGDVPYKDGDIYKLYVHNEHSVENNSNENRYHLTMQAVNLEF